jgi:glutathione S-transferase
MAPPKPLEKAFRDMTDRILVIGNKNYSSWSLRAWLLLRQAGIPFREIRIPLKQDGTRAAVLQHSPSGKMPAVIEDGLTVWESLSICEWAAERFPDKGLWPADPAARAVARSVASEMHGGFVALRQSLPMDIRSRYPNHAWPAEAQADIDRVQAIWADCRRRYGAGGPFLFGRFGIADAMYAPVATRFRSFNVKLTPVAEAYVQAIFDLPAMREWVGAAEQEAEVIDYLAL